jgi:hypothetical protein
MCRRGCGGKGDALVADEHEGGFACHEWGEGGVTPSRHEGLQVRVSWVRLRVVRVGPRTGKGWGVVDLGPTVGPTGSGGVARGRATPFLSFRWGVVDEGGGKGVARHLVIQRKRNVDSKLKLLPRRAT